MKPPVTPPAVSSARRLLTALFSSLLVLCAATTALATNFTVTSLGDAKPTLGGAGSGTSGDLRYCITQANYGAAGSTHVVTFAVTGTVTLSGYEIVINSDTTISGPGAASLSISGNNVSRVIYVAPNHRVVISDVTITKGNGFTVDSTGLDSSSLTDDNGGGLYNDRSDLTLRNCVITQNTSNYEGGGVVNSAHDFSGGHSSKMMLQNCAITYNKSLYSDAGGIYNYGYFGGTATLEMTDCVVSNNTANGYGGGIHNDGYWGGGSSPTAAMTISNSTVSANSCYSGGAGISNHTANLTMTGCTISGNLTSGSYSSGAGVLSQGTNSDIRFIQTTVSGNQSAGSGGGISNGNTINSASLMKLVGCTLTANTAVTMGGGILNQGNSRATLSIERSTIAGNAAQQRGGGVCNFSSTYDHADILITNSSIVGNAAIGGGGGVANDKPQGGTSSATVEFRNTLIALNITGANYGSTYGTATSTGFNLSDDATCLAFFTATGDKNSTPAGLHVDAYGKPVLQNNGGPTKTVALLAGSAAIDAGKAANDPQTNLPATTDQRGFARTVDTPGVANAANGDGTDIGAFEYGSGPSINVFAGAHGTAGGGGTYPFGATATVTSTADIGYVFANWTEGATVVSTTPSYSFTVTTNRTLVANFRTPIPATIRVAKTSGSPITLTNGASSVEFAGALIGGSAPQTFTIYNDGDLNLILGTLFIDGTNSGDFSILQSPSSPLAAAGSSNFVISFAPSAVGIRNAVLHIPSNDAATSSFTVNLTGTGYTTPPAQITSPIAGTTFTSTSVTFNWNTGVGVSSYALWIGSTAGAYDVHSSSVGTNRSRTVTLPDDGRSLYVTLWSLIGGSYQSSTANYSAYRAPTPVKAQITSPANGSALLSPSIPLVWNAGVGVTSCYLFAGTTPGGSDLYAANEGSGTSRTISNIPADKKIHVTLWSLIKGAYQANYYVFNPLPSVKAALASPADGSTLSGGTLALSWNAGVGASKYLLWVGSSPGGYDIGSVDAGTALSRNVTVPQDGGPIYLTLWSLINGGYQSNSYWFTTALPISGSRPARIVSPANATTLGNSTLNLTWDQGVGVTSYALWVGSTPDGYDIYSGLEGGSMSKSVVVPADGRRIYVTLHSLIGSSYQSNSYYFTAPTLPDSGAAQISSPVIGSTLTDSTLPLVWNSAAGATQYFLFVGNSPGASDLYAGSQGTSLSRTVTGIPTDGRPVYVTLYSWIANAWRSSNAWFIASNTAIGNRRALITSPTNGTALPAASATFNWSGGAGVAGYALWIGSSPGGYDLWSSAENSSATSRTVTLPTDGRKIYVTLYSQLSGAWQPASYLYTAANIAITKAVITSPASGSTLIGSSATFNWSASNAATAYALWIGRKPGASDAYAGAEGTNLTRTVSTLPVDGGPVYVTIYSLINGSWQSSEAIYQAALPP